MPDSGTLAVCGHKLSPVRQSGQGTKGGFLGNWSRNSRSLAKMMGSPALRWDDPGDLANDFARHGMTTSVENGGKVNPRLNILKGSTVEHAADRVSIGDLADIMTRTLPDGGLDRMTSERVEELLAVPALTAHL